MKKVLTILSMTIGGFLILVTPVFAHVSVKPNQVGVGAFQSFTVGVPVEKDMAATQIRLVLPEGLNHVTPNVKPGWTVEVKKTGEGEDAKATEIIWSGGSIPSGYREDLQFSAQAPAKEGELSWKAYQTYEDGTVVAWEKDPKAEQPKKDGKSDFSQFGPYSQTKIVNDLKDDHAADTKDTKDNNALLLSILAVVLSTASLGMQVYKKK